MPNAFPRLRENGAERRNMDSSCIAANNYHAAAFAHFGWAHPLMLKEDLGNSPFSPANRWPGLRMRIPRSAHPWTHHNHVFIITVLLYRKRMQWYHHCHLFFHTQNWISYKMWASTVAAQDGRVAFQCQNSDIGAVESWQTKTEPGKCSGMRWNEVATSFRFSPKVYHIWYNI